MSRILRFGSKSGSQEVTMDSDGTSDGTNDEQVSQYQLTEILVLRAELKEIADNLEDCERAVMLKLHKGADVEFGEHIVILYERPTAARIEWKEVVERRLGSEIVREEIEAAAKIAAMAVKGAYMGHYGLLVE